METHPLPETARKHKRRSHGGAPPTKPPPPPLPQSPLSSQPESKHRKSTGRIRKSRIGRINNPRLCSAHDVGAGRPTSRDGLQPPRLMEYDSSGGEDCERDRYAIWPTCVTLVVYIITITSRIWVVSSPAHWWVLHPDEVFQSLEVAHSEVYGYGFRPYEFLPPHTPGREMTSLADKQEAEMGMYSLRSWLYPRMFMVVFHVNDYFGSTLSPFVVGKLFHAVVASHLPVVVYFFTSLITMSRDIGHSAAILVSFSEHLTVLGTHTLVNSFLSPVLFASLAVLYTLTVNQHTLTIVSLTSAVNVDSSSSDSDNGSVCYLGTPTKDINSNTNKMDTQAISSNKDGRTNVPNQHKGSSVSVIGVGLILSLLCYIRLDLILFVVIVGVFIFTDVLLHPIKHSKSILCLILGALCGVIAGGLDDLISYGKFLMSPIQWFKFNVLTNLPNVIFGWDSSWTYVTIILNYNTITQLQTLIVAIAMPFAMYQILFVHDTKHGRWLNQCLLRLVLATVSLFVIYSLKGHKEVRFLHNVIVLFEISCAVSFTILYRRLITAAPDWRHTIKLHGRLVFALFAVGLLLNFPNSSDRSNQVWAYKGVWDSNHVNQCLDYIRQQPDATGLFSDRSIHETAAYTILHKDIPIFSLFHNEFIEFSHTVRKTLPSNDFFSKHNKVSVTVTSQISNFISTENSPLLLKALVANPSYNYMLLKTTRKLVHVGFKEVYRSGTMRVMRRTQDQTETSELQEIADSIPIGQNATVLEYEGSRLMTFGLRELARERLERAIDLDTACVRAFQLLALIYRDVGRAEDARQVTARCFRYNSKARCLESQ